MLLSQILKYRQKKLKSVLHRTFKSMTYWQATTLQQLPGPGFSGAPGGPGGGGAGSVTPGVNPSSYGIPGTPGTGGGGGGGANNSVPGTGANGYRGCGGPGVVIIAVPTPNYPGSAPGAAVSNPGSAPGMTVLTFTSSGTYVA